jgi:hypothetical protein
MQIELRTFEKAEIIRRAALPQIESLLELSELGFSGDNGSNESKEG